MRTKLIFLWAILFSLAGTAQGLQVSSLRCEYRKNPFGIVEPRPRLSWEIQSTGKDIVQTAYRIIVASDPGLLSENQGDIWDSKKVSSTDAVNVRYDGKRLLPGGTYYWKVMVWDNKGNSSPYSDISFWQMGLPDKADWQGATWIAFQELPDSSVIVPFAHGNGQKAWGDRPDVLPQFRKTFEIRKQLKSATVFISGLGQFELSVNGQKTGDHFLDPAWAQYSKQAQYVTFDITRQLQQGENVLGVMLGNGFYYIPGERYRKLTGAYGYPKMIALVTVKYRDGTSEIIVSNSSWKTTTSPIYFSSIYGGEDYDANQEQAGWNKPGFDDRSWSNALSTKGPGKMTPQIAEPVKQFEQFRPVSKKLLRPGVWIYDLGQNFSGIPAIEVEGQKGDTIRMYVSELINEDGSANQKATGSPHYYTYVLNGRGIEKWQPRFTYYGFRYIQVEGASPNGEDNTSRLPVIRDIRGIHIRNSAETIGEFSSSSELFNKTNELIKWAIKSNLASVVTDCPHREKLGWLEQTHLMGTSIQYNFDIAALYEKVIRDMMQAQTTDGMVPDIAPEYVQFGGGFRDSPEWGSAAVILPWYTYQWYGDKSVLEMAYPMMKKYVAYLRSKSGNHIISYGLGDWFDIGPGSPGVSQLTPLGVTATAMYYYDLTILVKGADLLDKKDEAKQFQDLASAVKTAFNNKYFDESRKQYASGSQTANAIAICVGLVDPAYKDAVLESLIKDLRSRNNALTAGDVGYRYVLRALEDAGRSDVIYDMNSRDDVPGYGYQLKKGATALTESWQAFENVSNNHLMLGHLMEWFYSGLCGIRQKEGSVGFKEIEIKPQPVGDIKYARASYKSVNGRIAVNWTKESDKFHLSVIIPVNTVATVYFPPASKKAPVKLGSGSYNFIVNLK